MLPSRSILAKPIPGRLEIRRWSGNDVRGENRLSELVKRAQRGEKVVLTTGRKKTPVAMIVALKPVKERVFDLFHHPDFDIPADFDELSEAEHRAWSE
jgi:antitoxin (DNA-binding transcriptional repressor) of toxin-antitoxin stability system